MPKFPNFTLDDDCWVTNAKLPNWAGYQIRNGPYGTVSERGKSDGCVHIVFAPEGRDESDLTENELHLIHWFIDNQAEVHQSMLSRLFLEYPAIQDEYLEYFEDETFAEKYLPEIRNEEDLKTLTGIVTVFIHQIESTEPYIGVELGCTWDDEHGVGILLHGAKPLEVGQADTAMTLWIAEKYAKVNL